VLKRLIRSLTGGRVAPDLDAELARLELEATAPALDFRAAVLGRAGDLCVSAGDIPRALSYYGRAIDGYLGASYYDSAIALCEKVIELSPGVVRARCTMSFLLLGKDLPYLRARGISSRVRDNLHEYVAAALNAGRGPIAVQRLKMMADVTEIEEVRRLIGDLLFDLQAPDEAAELHYSLFEERADLAVHDPEASTNQRLRWAEMLRIAIMDE
jgi:tetratricopeptide (TPR) repeat protein